MERDIHPAEIALFVAAALRGYRLIDSVCGKYYRVERGQVVIYTAATFKDVANLCGAAGRITLRQAAEHVGLRWPDSPESFLAAVKNTARFS